MGLWSIQLRLRLSSSVTHSYIPDEILIHYLQLLLIIFIYPTAIRLKTLVSWIPQVGEVSRKMFATVSALNYVILNYEIT